MEKILHSVDCIGKLVYSPLRSGAGDYIFLVNGVAEEFIDTLCQEDSYLVLSCDFTCKNGSLVFNTQEQIFHLQPEDELFVCPPEKVAAVAQLLRQLQLA